jgi:hypothetical protein
MRSRGWLEIATLGSSSWMPYTPQGVKGNDDDDDGETKKSTIFIWADSPPATGVYIFNRVLQKCTLTDMFLVLLLANHWHFQQYSALHIRSKGLIMFTQSTKQWELRGYGSAN